MEENTDRNTLLSTNGCTSRVKLQVSQHYDVCLRDHSYSLIGCSQDETPQITGPQNDVSLSESEGQASVSISECSLSQIDIAVEGNVDISFPDISLSSILDDFTDFNANIDAVENVDVVAGANDAISDSENIQQLLPENNNDIGEEPPKKKENEI